MALFFDKAWFDRELTDRGLSRSDMAAAATLSLEDLGLIFKDQLEVNPDHVHIWAGLLNKDPAEIAKRSGVSTRTRPSVTDAERIAAMEAKVARLESEVRRLTELFGRLSVG